MSYTIHTLFVLHFMSWSLAKGKQMKHLGHSINLNKNIYSICYSFFLAMLQPSFYSVFTISESLSSFFFAFLSVLIKRLNNFYFLSNIHIQYYVEFIRIRIPFSSLTFLCWGGFFLLPKLMFSFGNPFSWFCYSNCKPYPCFCKCFHSI